MTSDYRFVYLGPRGTFTGLHADVLRSFSWSAHLSHLCRLPLPVPHFLVPLRVLLVSSGGWKLACLLGPLIYTSELPCLKRCETSECQAGAQSQ